MEDTVALSALQQIKKLDEERAKLLEGAKKEALAKANEAVEELNALGFEYHLSTSKPARKAGEKRQPKGGPCPICNFATTPIHDRRSHRSQAIKKPFTDAELAKLGLVKA